MRRAILIGLVSLVVGATAVPTTAQGSARLFTDAERYKPKALVTIRLVNEGAEPITLTGDWTIEKVTNSKGQALYVWPQDQTTVGPGEERVWIWDQHEACYGGCQNVWEGPLVGPGRYRVAAPTSAGTFETIFDIGRYFTLGFRYHPDDTFVVFVARRKAVREMRAEADAKRKRLIVSGIVAEAEDYNAPWSYTMSPESIATGEYFIEVCDASPDYVEENRDDWMGQRWCPWSSYVARRGR